MQKSKHRSDTAVYYESYICENVKSTQNMGLELKAQGNGQRVSQSIAANRIHNKWI